MRLIAFLLLLLAATSARAAPASVVTQELLRDATATLWRPGGAE